VIGLHLRSKWSKFWTFFFDQMCKFHYDFSRNDQIQQCRRKIFLFSLTDTDTHILTLTLSLSFSQTHTRTRKYNSHTQMYMITLRILSTTTMGPRTTSRPTGTTREGGSSFIRGFILRQRYSQQFMKNEVQLIPLNVITG